jgi:hypothetical protein
MKKDILIDLDAQFNKLTNAEESKIITESVDIQPDVTESTAKIDLNVVLEEWAWRCDRGYPDINNTSDKIKLQEVLDEMNIPLPFQRVQLSEGKDKSANLKKFAALVNGEVEGISPDIPQQAKKFLFDIFSKLSSTQQTICLNSFQTSTLASFIKSDWEKWKDFFDVAPKGMGRGEMMAVMAIKNAKSGGTAEKDLKIGNKVWEVKEDPTGIRMAQSGFSGRFKYINELRKFYELLTSIELNDSTKDTELKDNLLKVFGSESTANSMYEILTKNFRGDGYGVSKKDKKASIEDNEPVITDKNFFERMIAAAEYPTGVIDLHYEGYKQLKNLRATIISQKELVNNAKLVLKTAGSDEDSQFYISAKDAEQIKDAGKKGKEAKIKVSAPAKKDFKEFLHSMLQIVRHPFVKNPDAIIEDFIERKNDYFAHIEGFVYYLKQNPQPYLGPANEFIIYGISQSQGKIEHKKYAEKTNSPFIKAQLGK